MKILIPLFFLFFTLFTHASSYKLKVEVLSAEYGIEDHLQNKSLCLTIIRIPKTGDLVGIYEDIYDCFYARLANKFPGKKITIDLEKLHSFEMSELYQYLQIKNAQLKLLFSEGE